jgi:hypothetical protein
MTTISFELYETICDLLENEELDVETIATMANTTVEAVHYVSRAEGI